MSVDPNAAIEITSFEWVPEQARGYVKDLRIRWALEEIGLPYRERLLAGAGGEKSSEHMTDQPFGQVPVYKEGDVSMFESGAILLHIGERDERLLPREARSRARAISWMFAALNSVEPFVQTLLLVRHASEGQDWQDAAQDSVRPFAQMRLSQLSSALGDREWLEDRFTIGDLLMIDVLRAAPEDELVTAHPNLAAYVERGTMRPAFKAAMAAQLAALAVQEPA